MPLERNYCINTDVHKHYIEARHLGYNIFGTILCGSQNYDLDIYTEKYKSDIDTKCIVLPSIDDIIRNKEPISTTHIRANNEHIDLKDIRLMWEQFRKQNLAYIELLFSNFRTIADDFACFWERMRLIADDIAHADPIRAIRTMSGQAMEKRKALQHPYPTIKWKIDKWGYDGKQLHHIIRICKFMEKFVRGDPYRECLKITTDKDLLIKAKLNQFSLSEAIEMADAFMHKIDELKEHFISSYSGTVNMEVYEKMDNIKADIMRMQFRKELQN